VVTTPDGLRVPAPEDEVRFWALLEAAWALLGPDVRQARQALVVRPAGSPVDISVVRGALPIFLNVLGGHCCMLPSTELTSLDRVLERKLWDIDRVDIHVVTDGSTDGFLYTVERHVIPLG
jgi:hypothetical protein